MRDPGVGIGAPDVYPLAPVCGVIVTKPPSVPVTPTGELSVLHGVVGTHGAGACTKVWE